MIAIPGGRLLMGSDEYYRDEGPVHEREVAPFRLDAHPVTNEEYAAFVDATGYVTVAERELDPADFPGADPADMVPGSMVFTPTAGPVDLRDWRQWWRWQPGAYWREPEGPGSSIDERMRHPVVHVSFEDAGAYATWAGKRLPTETEWEWAARGGLVGARFAWGDEERPDGRLMANSWQGRFPFLNTGAEGWVGTSPVGTFAPNGYGLVDMAGNTWEWTTDFYTSRHAVPGATGVDAGARTNLLAATPTGESRRVLKGGSQLCSPEYCLRYRPAARSPQSDDTAMTHIGFRCAR
jgi:sulfatase modifying factor 1